MNLNKQMLKPLPSEIRSIVRSGININTVAQCVEELVFNSIDAGAKNIHIGINLDQFNVRVEDDGDGLNEVDLEAIGVRFTTSKCSTLIDLNNLRYYGFRGEALASIIDVSNTVDIISRPKSTTGIELKKKYENGAVQGFIEKHNTQVKKSGTTIVVGKLLSKLPVRQQRIDKSLQLEEVKSSLEKIALINPNVSIELRNEKNGTQLFSFKPSNCYAEAINQMFMSRIGFEVKFVQEHFLHKTFFFNLSVSNDFVKKKHYQFVFLNNRYIKRCRIHKWLGNFILDRRKDSSSPSTEKYPIFILNINCPFSEYDITLEPKKQTVEFKDWDAVYSGIDGLILKLRHKNNLVTVDKKVQSIDKNVSLVSSYDVKGALHSRFVAREVDVPSNKSSCTDSDQGSIGKTFLPDPKAPGRNLIRTSHSTHVVNVREIRKKRKLENTAKATTYLQPVPLKLNLSSSVVKPNLTIGTFKRFPEWKEEFDNSAPLPPKRSRESHNHQENHKYFVPHAPMKEKAGPSQEAAAEFGWKINRYLKSYQPGAVVTTTVGESLNTGATGKSVHSKNPVIPSPFESVDSLNNNVSACPKSPSVECYEHEDVEGCIFGWSAMVSKNHFERKWTFRDTKADIISRLVKYYKASGRESERRRKQPTSSGIASNKQTNVSSLSTTVVPTENHQGVSSQLLNTLISSSSSSSNAKPSFEAKCTSNTVPPIFSCLKPPKFPVPSFSSLNKQFVAVTTGESNKYEPTSKQLFANAGTEAGSCSKSTVTSNINLQQPPPVSSLFKLSNSNVCNMKSDAVPPVVNSSCNCNYSESFQVPDVFNVEISSSSLVDSSTPAPKILPPVKSSNLELKESEQGTTCENSTNCAPPLLTLFPVQKSFLSDWSDKMISCDFNESDDNFPSDWAAEIVLDGQNQEWLRTLDNNGRALYINLSSGESSYDIAHLFGSLRKVTAGEMKKINPVRYNWLRRHFPRGFRQFWNGDGREIAKDGDLTKLSNSVIGDSLLKCINQQNPDDHLSKWTDKELQNVSKYFSGNKDSSVKTVNNVSATGILGWKDLGGTTSSFRFSREDFGLVRVIGQYDKKFILTLIRKSSTENENLVIFDQHAVHERIRLEQLIADSFVNPKSAMKYLRGLEVIPSYPLPLSETEVRIMQSYTELFMQAALTFEVVSSTIVKIKSVPKCFIEKCSNESSASREGTFRNLVHGLIQELIHTIMETKVACLTALPKAVNTVLCSQACHGAIKFGDELSLDECKELILNLRNCKNLFQCAHGRPSVVPLIKGQDLLKVSSAGYNCLQVRPSSTSVLHNSLPTHEECSKYFCDSNAEKTSGYFSNFSLLDADASNTAYKKAISTDDNRNSLPFSQGLKEKASTSAVSDFFSTIAGENALNDDEQDSPYFFNMPIMP